MLKKKEILLNTICYCRVFRVDFSRCRVFIVDFSILPKKLDVPLFLNVKFSIFIFSLYHFMALMSQNIALLKKCFALLNLLSS